MKRQSARMNVRQKITSLKKYSLPIWILWITAFLGGIELVGPFMIPFFKDWGGLNQTQIQSLQSWFMLWIFILEIPTGLIGDVKGRKFSVLMSDFMMILGPIVYALIPDFRMFLLAEFIFAVGIAFKSGAREALLYDTVKEKGFAKEYGRISNIESNLGLIGMIVGSALGGLLIRYVELNELFMMWAIPFAISFILILLFVKEPKYAVKELSPSYLKTFKVAMMQLKNNRKLRKIALYSMVLASITYFVIWLNQNVLLEVGIVTEDLGPYRIVLLVAEIIFSTFIIELLARTKDKRRILIVSVMLTALGFLVTVIPNYWGAMLFIVLAGGIGVKLRTILSVFINPLIEAEQRATVLSGISMIRQIILVVINPLVGFMVDVNLGLTLGVLGLITVVIGLFMTPKNQELVYK